MPNMKALPILGLVLSIAFMAGCGSSSSQKPRAPLATYEPKPMELNFGGIRVPIPGTGTSKAPIEVDTDNLGYVGVNTVVVDRMAAFPKLAGTQFCQGGFMGVGRRCQRVGGSDPGSANVRLVAVDPNSQPDTWGSTQRQIARSVGDRSSGAYELSYTVAQQGRGRCLALIDASNQPIPVRDGDGSERYLFESPIAENQLEYDEAATALKDAEDRIPQVIEYYEGARRRQATNVAWQPGVGACVKPAMAPFPPDPGGMSENEITYHAIGFCVELMKRRHNEADVYAALKANFLDEAIEINKKWSLAATPRCVVQLRSQTDDWMLRMFGSMFGQSGMMGAMQDGLEQCMRQATSACLAPRQQWAAEVTRIRAAPDQALAACQNDLQIVTGHEALLAEAQQSVVQRQAELTAVSSRMNGIPSRANLADARCHLQSARL